MDLTVFFQTFFGWIGSIFNELNSHSISVSGSSIGLGFLLIAFLITSIIISVFWRGAKG